MEKQIDPNTMADDFYDTLNRKIASAREKAKLLNVTIEQSQSEITRLTQKSLQVTAQLQKCQGELEQVSKQEIRSSFSEALDSQQRLLVMRGQLEKLIEQKNQLQELEDHLEELKASYKSTNTDSDSRTNQTHGLEMFEMLVTAQEAERQRLTRKMHDGPAQALSNFIVQAEIAAKLFDIDPVKARDELEKLKSAAMNTFQKVRKFITEIRPMSLDTLGLVHTIKKFVALTNEEMNVNITMTLNGEERKLEPYIEAFAFRSIQELVLNSIQRNQNYTDMHIEVSLNYEDDNLQIGVSDDGKEFTLSELKTKDGLGIDLIEEGVSVLGGTFEIQKTNKAGMQVVMDIPVFSSPVN